MKYSIKYVGILLVTLLCYQCETTVEPAEIQSSFRIIHYDALPAAIRATVITTENSLKNAYAYKHGTPFGALVAEQVHERITPDGKSSYTMALHKNGEDFYYDNLVINEDAEGTIKTRIIRYQPDPNWYYKHKTEGLGYADYSGDITIFNSAGEQLSSVRLISGQPQKAVAETTASRANGECEIVDIQEAGLLQDGVFYVYEITITVDCSGTGTGGGGDDGLSNGFGNEGGEEGGGGGSPGGGGGNGGPGEPIETVPVEAEDNIIIDPDFINDFPCQSQIVHEAYGVCSPLTQVILDLFETNDGTNLVYTHSNTISGNGSTTPNSQLNTSCSNHTCDITIRLSTSYLQTATDISIARTVIHESIHAIFVYMFEEGLLTSPDGITDPDFADLANAHINYLSGLPSNLGQSHHDLMASFVEDIANSLSQYGEQNGYNLPYQFYNDMAWGGLTHRLVRDNQGNIVYDNNGNPTFEETPWFQLAVSDPIERDRITNRLAAEVENQTSGSETPSGQPCVN